jgi:hypothetical protein
VIEYIRFKFELGDGPISYLISRFGFSAHGWSHVRPLLDDGSSIDSYESWVHAPKGGWPGYPPSIPPGVQHRPPCFRPVKASQVISIPVTAQQKQAWLNFLWDGARKGLAYDHAAIEDFVLGGNRKARKSDICSAWATKTGRVIGLGHHTNVSAREISPDMLYALSQEAWGGVVRR